MSADTMQYLEELGVAATSLVSQSVANCVSPAIEMETLGDDMLDLAAVPSPFASRSSSAASLGLVGLFTQPGERSSPVSTLDVPASPRMVK
jgi:hypothetical protein